MSSLLSCIKLKFCSVTVILKQFKCAYSIVVLYRVQLSYSIPKRFIVPAVIRFRTCGLTKCFHDSSWYNTVSVDKFHRYLLHFSRVVNNIRLYEMVQQLVFKKSIHTSKCYSNPLISGLYRYRYLFFQLMKTNGNRVLSLNIRLTFLEGATVSGKQRSQTVQRSPEG